MHFFHNFLKKWLKIVTNPGFLFLKKEAWLLIISFKRVIKDQMISIFRDQNIFFSLDQIQDWIGSDFERRSSNRKVPIFWIFFSCWSLKLDHDWWMMSHQSSSFTSSTPSFYSLECSRYCCTLVLFCVSNRTVDVDLWNLPCYKTLLEYMGNRNSKEKKRDKLLWFSDFPSLIWVFSFTFVIFSLRILLDFILFFPLNHFNSNSID